MIYSTSALPTEQQSGLDAGASIYLTKPSDLTNIGNLSSELIKSVKDLGERNGASAGGCFSAERHNPDRRG